MIRELSEKAEEMASGQLEEVATRAGEGVVASLISLAKGESHEVQYRIKFAAIKDTWLVSSMSMSETLTEPYTCVLEVATENKNADPSELLGKDVTLTYERPTRKEHVRGIVSRVEHGRSIERFTTARVYIVPALAAMGYGRNTRIFQDMTVPEILSQVLKEGLDPYERKADISKLEADYPKREYTVQYHESDLEFITRLMEEEGIAFHFEHADDKEVVRLTEKNFDFGVVKTLGGNEEIKLAQHGGESSEEEPLSRFELVSKLGPTSVNLVDFDWTQAKIIKGTPENENGQEKKKDLKAHEFYDVSRALTFAEYDEGSHRYGYENSPEQLGKRFEALAVTHNVAKGESRVTGLRPGLIFELKEHPEASLNGRYLITRVTHAGKTPEATDVGTFVSNILVGSEHKKDDKEQPVYSNVFECIPETVPYRKQRVTRKPRVHGAQTATVVGPSGEEIYTDAHGRIKVQFHWDRVGKNDDHSSCFVRVVQSWAGQGWGCTFLPRIGMEVMITFLDGDPDRPLVTGCLYNGANRPPYTLPDDKTKTTLKTQSTPGGDGFNELRFEDAAGSEEIFLHAQKDHNQVVKNNKSTSVGGSETLSVSGKRTKTVTKDETNTLKAKRTTEVEGDETLTVLSGNSTETVSKGSKTVEITEGAMEVHAKRQIVLLQNSDHFLSLDNKAELKSKSDVKINSADTASVLATPDGKLTLKANTSIKLECGGSVLELSSDGNVRVNGMQIVISTQGGSLLADPTGASVSGTKVEVTAQTEAVIKGAMVKIN